MKNIIVGTAGHIDHGKTALVKALTGIDADRLAEEKRRGITIDLGFAHLQLTATLRLGFVDVPGHERFVRNMLAGAAGIDLVLFVIAADESIKPQTREHFDICRLLGVQSGIVVLTKADLVDADLLDLVRLEVAEFVAGSFLEAAPVIPVSSVTGEGLPQLNEELVRAAGAVQEKNASGWARLPVDRAFSMRGFGTVVTGTLVAGVIGRDQELELYPTSRRLRVRGVQVSGKNEDRARAGSRTAVNLAGIEPAEIARGMTLSEPGRFQPVTRIDCRLDLLPSAKPLRNRAPVHFHGGTSEIEAEVRLLDRRVALQPGESAWVRIILRDPALLLPGDRFIIRMFSPVTTIGGGVVVDISNHRYRASEDAAARLKSFSVMTLLEEQPYGISARDLVAWTGLPSLPASSEIVTVADWRITNRNLSALRERILDHVRKFHKENSLLPGIAKQDLKGRVAMKAATEIFELAISTHPALAVSGDIVHLKTHKVVLKQDEERARHSIEDAFQRAGLSTPPVAEVLQASGVEPTRARSILQLLLKEAALVRITDDLVLHVSALTGLRAKILGKQGTRFSVPEFKNWTGISRKYAIPLLEYFDRTHVTRRDGDDRIVL